MSDETRRGDIQDTERVAESIRRELGADNLGPYTEYEWGELNGKLSALRCGPRRRLGSLDT